MPLKIAIIGAGPAGCLLARLLQMSKEQISVTIFELEGSMNFRSQGGTLDLHDDTGQAALKAANLFDEFEKYARYDGEAMKIADKNLLCYMNQSASNKGSVTGRPEIDRPRLRQLLFESLAPDTVQWNHKLQRVDSDLNLHFANGNIERDFDLIVGADGAWSHVRTRLTDTKPFYSGLGGHSLTMPNAEHTHPELHSLVNRGSLFSWSDGKSISAQQMGDGSLNIGTWSLRPENWQKECGYDVHDASAVKAACKKQYEGWDSRLVAFTQEAADRVLPRDLYMLPIGMRWTHVKGVTLVGDAAHLMTPFAGEGVNAAFTDSWKLAQAIIAAAASASPSNQSEEQLSTALDKNVLAFEEEMFARAKEVQQLTYDMMTLQFFTPGSPRTAIERYILRAISDHFGYWVMKLVATPIVYAYFGVFKMIW